MSQRQAKLHWLKDVLDHLQDCQRQLEWVTEPEAVQVLTAAMLRDLECCRKLCEGIAARAASVTT